MKIQRWTNSALLLSTGNVVFHNGFSESHTSFIIDRCVGSHKRHRSTSSIRIGGIQLGRVSGVLNSAEKLGTSFSLPTLFIIATDVIPLYTLVLVSISINITPNA